MQVDPERLKRRRTQLGLSQTELALMAGIEQGRLSKIENNKYPTSDSNLQESLAKALQVSVDWLCGRDANEAPATALPLAQAIDKALFEVVKTEDVEPEDYHAARQALMSSSIRIEHSDLPRIARAWLIAAKQLRLEGQVVNSLNITMQVAVNATTSASFIVEKITEDPGSTSGIRPAFDDDGQPVTQAKSK